MIIDLQGIVSRDPGQIKKQLMFFRVGIIGQWCYYEGLLEFNFAMT